MTVHGDLPISLRAWPSEDKKTNALQTVIARINHERGNFRLVNEDALEQEVAALENGSTEKAASDSGDGEGEGDEDEVEEPDRLKELMTARANILGQLDTALNGSAMALDFISLLLSKDSPVQAGLSISPHLKALVPTGTLGADKVQGVRATEAVKNDKKLVGNGWKVQALNKSVDSILASASRLEKEIESETKYWEQVLAVSEKGWAVCRLPQENHTLAVRYGFSEAAPEFRNRGLAALRRTDDGGIILDQNLSDSPIKAVRVRIRTGNVITGTAKLPKELEDDASIEALILQARNTIFEEELYHELDREARILTNQGVRSISNTLTCSISPSQEIILDYIPVSDAESSQFESSADNTLAEAFSLALHLLLSYAHHQNLRRRSQPPRPISSAKRPTPPYSLLRPLLTRVHHQTLLSSMQSLLDTTCSLLNAASTTAGYACVNEATAKPLTAEKISTLHVLDTLTNELSGEAELKIGESIKFTISFKTMIYPIVTSQFKITASGIDAIPAPPILNNFGELQQYMYYATAWALASTCVKPSMAKQGTGTGDDDDVTNEVEISEKGAVGWYSTMQGPILRKSYKPLGRSKQLTFELSENELRVVWGWVRGGDSTSHHEKGEGSYVWKRNGAKLDSLEKIMDKAGTYE